MIAEFHADFLEVPVDFEKHIHDVRIEMGAASFLNDENGLPVAEGGFIGPLRREGIVHIRDGHDACG